MEGWRLLIVQALAADGRTPDGDPQLAIDRLGAGVGEMVVISSDGKFVRQMLDSETTPVRWSLIGIEDES
jgi:ethanolamine utilization protein EutN